MKDNFIDRMAFLSIGFFIATLSLCTCLYYGYMSIEPRTVEGVGFVVTNGLDIHDERIMFTQTSLVSCETNSMSPAFDCGNKLLEKSISLEEPLQVGSVYVYNGSDGLVFHRFIACMNENCSKLLFKGDNNLYPDKIITRNHIESIVVGVLYES